MFSFVSFKLFNGISTPFRLSDAEIKKVNKYIHGGINECINVKQLMHIKC